jgi:hypothetical protein
LYVNRIFVLQNSSNPMFVCGQISGEQESRQEGDNDVKPHLQPAATATTSAEQSNEIFKKPSKPLSKKSPVSVDTTSLKLPSGNDVEMLSAQSTMDTQTPRTPLGQAGFWCLCVCVCVCERERECVSV